MRRGSNFTLIVTWALLFVSADSWGVRTSRPFVFGSAGAAAFTYAVGSNPGNVLAEANAMGAQGFAYYAPFTFGNLYVKDSEHQGTYSYALVQDGSSLSETVAQMNMLGGQGFAYYLPLTAGNLYVKDSSHSGTYSYQSGANVSSIAALQTQMNTMGAQGFAFYTPLTAGYIYVKDSGRSATYSYNLAPASFSSADTMTQLNAMGQQGFKLLANFSLIAQIIIGSDIRNVYCKDSSRPGSYSYTLLAAPSGRDNMLAQLNERGAQGFAYLVQFFLIEGTRNIYVKFDAAASCSYSVSPASQSFDASGGNGSAAVTTGSGCFWTAVSDVAWITISSGASGSGNGSVAYSVADNADGMARTGMLLVAGHPITIKQAGKATVVSAASYSSSEVTAETIVAVFGVNLATTTQAATTLPLPTLIAGTAIKVKDSLSVLRDAPLFFVSPGQINYLIPSGTAAGSASVMVTVANATLATGTVRIATVAPGLFSANASGQGVAAAVVLRVRDGGAQSFEPIGQYDTVLQQFVAVPIDMGPATDQVFLILYGTGWRSRSSLSAVAMKLGGSDAEALYAGPQGDFVGLDQLNVRVPRSLAGRGEVDLVLTVDGKSANIVRASFR